MSTSLPGSLDRAVAASRDRKNLLEKTLLDISRAEAKKSLRGVGVGLVATVDLLNDIYYAPVTNIARHALQKAFSSSGGQAGGALEGIRNRFPLQFSDGGVLRQILDQAERYGLDDALFLSVDLRDGSIALAGVIPRPDDASASKPSSSELPEDLRRITADVLPSLKKIRKILQPASGEAHRLVIILRPRVFPGRERKTPPSPQFCQVGFLLCPRHVANNVKRLGVATWPLLTKSAHIALNVLFERERYYERSVSQCSLGYMVKCGPAVELSKQYRQLKKLEGRSEEITVDVVAQGAQITNPDPANVSWYAMTYFRLPSLTDVLTGVNKIEPYEVRAVTRAAVRNLMCAYWQRKKYRPQGFKPVPAPDRVVLAGAWAQAHWAATELREALSSCVEIASHKIPIRNVKQSINFVVGEHAKPLEDFKRFVDGKFPFKWMMHSDEGTNPPLDGVHPKYALDAIKRAVSRGRRPRVSARYDAYTIHGDAHFANFLLDASVPEHPVIVSIDPQLPTKNKAIEPLARRFAKVNAVASLELHHDHDRTWDYAKLLLATALGYGMVYRRGVSYIITESGGCPPTMKIAQQSPEATAMPSESGGLSPAWLYRFAVPMCDDAPKYHLWSNDVVVDHFLEYIRASDYSRRSATAAVIRLWLLTIRHGLSIAAKLLPNRIEASRAMYGCVCGFIGNGLECVLEAIERRLDVDVDTLARCIIKSPLELPSN